MSMGEEMVVDAFAWDEVARFGVGFDVKTLEVAVENGQNELARFLYEQLATMKPQELKERRPKIYARAAYLGNKPLLNIFASLDKEFPAGVYWNLLSHASAQGGQTDLMFEYRELFLHSKAQTLTVDLLSVPIHFSAAYGGKLETVRALCERDTRQPHPYGTAVLNGACAGGHMEIVQYALSYLRAIPEPRMLFQEGVMCTGTLFFLLLPLVHPRLTPELVQEWGNAFALYPTMQVLATFPHYQYILSPKQLNVLYLGIDAEAKKFDELSDPKRIVQSKVFSHERFLCIKHLLAQGARFGAKSIPNWVSGFDIPFIMAHCVANSNQVESAFLNNLAFIRKPIADLALVGYFLVKIPTPISPETVTKIVRSAVECENNLELLSFLMESTEKLKIDFPMPQTIARDIAFDFAALLRAPGHSKSRLRYGNMIQVLQWFIDRKFTLSIEAFLVLQRGDNASFVAAVKRLQAQHSNSTIV